MFHQFKGASTVTLETALTVLQRGWASIEQLRYASAWRMTQCPRIGRLALMCGKLTKAEVLTVLAEQRSIEKTFGQTAVALGLLNQADVYELLMLQTKKIPSIENALVALGIITPEQAEEAASSCSSPDMTISAEDDLDPVMMS